MKAKPVLITGCSSGIGLCVARGLAKRGYWVFATARKSEDVASLKKEGLESLKLDLSDSDSIQYAFNQIITRTGGFLYGLFNNGGFGQPGALEDLPREALRNQFETNVFGLHELTRLVLPIMRKKGEGRIIQNSSVLGFIALPFRGAYIASKYAIEGLTDTLRLELQGTGVYVCLVEPGPILSRFRENAFKMYKENIDISDSPFKTKYGSMEKRLQNEITPLPFTLPGDAVLAKVIHALESSRPKERYYVTFPTYLFGYLKRILPTRLMDYFLFKASNQE
tara:strand:+ start:1941 stop:2780 length:840 start_codon:yes stop_codon:yes gene_type:complete